MTTRQTVDALDDIDADTVARARYEGEKVLLRYVSPKVRIAYLSAIERAKAKTRAAAISESQASERCGG